MHNLFLIDSFQAHLDLILPLGAQLTQFRTIDLFTPHPCMTHPPRPHPPMHDSKLKTQKLKTQSETQNSNSKLKTQLKLKTQTLCSRRWGKCRVLFTVVSLQVWCPLLSLHFQNTSQCHCITKFGRQETFPGVLFHILFNFPF